MRSVAALSRSFAKAVKTPIEFLEANGFQVHLRPNDDPGNEESVAACIGESDAAIVSAQDKVGATVFDRCPNLKVVADHAIGCDRIDMDEAKRRGIHVFTCPANHESVADLTWGLILSLSRHICTSAAAVRRDEWNPSGYIGIEVYKKTLGIVGYGRIGRCVAARARGFENEILFYDPFIESGHSEDGAEQVALDELLSRSDIISLHLPLNEETRGLIGRKELEMMKTGVLLVNTSRGGLIDEQALYDQITSGKIAGAGLDVFAVEPPKGNPLLTLDQVIPVPHIGAQTVDANLKVGMMAAEGIVSFLS